MIYPLVWMGFKVSYFYLCCCQFLLLYLLVFVLCIEVLLCWRIDIYNCYVFLLDWSLYRYGVSFLISCHLYFKVCFVWYKDCYSSFLLLPIYMEYIFPSSYFQPMCVFRSEVGSCIQHIYGSFFLIHSASLYLLVGAFNPFTFKVIIDIFVPIAIFLIVWGWFCRSFFFSCISWLYKSL